MSFTPIVTFKNWLRRWLQLETTATMHGQPMTFEQAAYDVVERARLGDQIAVAIITEVRDNAAKGDSVAKKAYKLIDEYTKKNPHGNLNKFDVSVGEEEAEDLAAHICGENYTEAVIEKVPAVASQSKEKAIVTLANGPSLLPQRDGTNRLRDVGEALPTEEERWAFITGAKNGSASLAMLDTLNQEAQHALFLGYLMGAARCIQAVRHPNTPISLQSPVVGWELGE